MRRVYPLRSHGESGCHASVIMLAYNCHACPCAWARELYVRVAFIPRSKPSRLSDHVYCASRAVRKGLRLPSATYFHFLCDASGLTLLGTMKGPSPQDYRLQPAEKCVAWGLDARTTRRRVPPGRPVLPLQCAHAGTRLPMTPDPA